ncbi:MAG TPA: Ada metal-binding domain-containing protein [Mycobacterium sp.]
MVRVKGECVGQYRAAKAGVTRYDVHFIAAVRSIGIYCRPSPAGI